MLNSTIDSVSRAFLSRVSSSYHILRSGMESGYVKRNAARFRQEKDQNQDASSECICYRPYSNVICNGCGFWTKGRVRYNCPQHPKIIFLHDHTQCPRCKSYDFMLTEI